MFVYPKEEITFISTSRLLSSDDAKKVNELMLSIIELWETKFGDSLLGPSGRNRVYFDMAFRENTTDQYFGQTFRMRPWKDDDDQYWNFIWRDVAISWYKRYGRETHISRIPSDEELVIMKEEIFKEILDLDIIMIAAGKVPGLEDLAHKLKNNFQYASKDKTNPRAAAHASRRANVGLQEISEELSQHKSGFPPNVFSKGK